MKNKLFISPATDIGLLILRIGIGIMFILHGLPKMMGGTETWQFLGSQMSVIGVGFGFTFWGFMAALSETLGGLLLIPGLFVRPAAMLMLFTMIIATLMHLSVGDGLKGASHAMEMGIVFLSVIFTGAGRYSLDHRLFAGKR
ncbi:MAG TPA: DoxX family protein [Bacteroidales bacterium]|nr:DoxX family protein [Bacteroidales bacterium]HQI70281.1 DoxX family protein [Bacteroidales bacterium]